MKELHDLQWLKREISTALLHLQEQPTHEERRRLESYLHAIALETVNVERRQAWQEGHEDGIDCGWQDGYDAAVDEQNDLFEQEFEEGVSHGRREAGKDYDAGYDRGYDVGYTAGRLDKDLRDGD